MKWIVDKLIERAKRTPFFHLLHADGSLYMERFWLHPTRALDITGYVNVETGEQGPAYLDLPHGFKGISARLHHICTPDLDREMHNHPWSFVSIVLRGGYTERRPRYESPRWHEQLTPLDMPVSLNPRLVDAKLVDMLCGPPLLELDEEPHYDVVRRAGSIARRKFSDRHRIVDVLPDTWTLFIMGPKRQSWGFFTRDGFVNYREFESAHNKQAV